MSDLTSEELAICEASGMSPERYSALKGVSSIVDYQVLVQADREQAERDRLKAAVREALDAREAAKS